MQNGISFFRAGWGKSVFRFTIGAVFIIMGSMDNLVLIGMPSSGESTAGVLLAKRIGYGFIDCDLIIQGEEGKKLSEIIEDKGVDGFIGIE